SSEGVLGELGLDNPDAEPVGDAGRLDGDANVVRDPEQPLRVPLGFFPDVVSHVNHFYSRPQARTHFRFILLGGAAGGRRAHRTASKWTPARYSAGVSAQA